MLGDRIGIDISVPARECRDKMTPTAVGHRKVCIVALAKKTTRGERERIPRKYDAATISRICSGYGTTAGIGIALVGLCWDAKGDWKRAHESAQQDEGPAGSWVHAYLHRKEGDSSNAGYWYSRAGKPPAQSSLEQEWIEIAKSLLRGS